MYTQTQFCVCTPARCLCLLALPGPPIAFHGPGTCVGPAPVMHPMLQIKRRDAKEDMPVAWVWSEEKLGWVEDPDGNLEKVPEFKVSYESLQAAITEWGDNAAARLKHRDWKVEVIVEEGEEEQESSSEEAEEESDDTFASEEKRRKEADKVATLSFAILSPWHHPVSPAGADPPMR